MAKENIRKVTRHELVTSIPTPRVETVEPSLPVIHLLCKVESKLFDYFNS